MRTRSRLVTVLVTVLVAAVGAAGLAGPARAAGPRAEIVLDAGRTALVEGDPDGGGVSLGLSFLGRLEDHFRFGMMGFADDLGERTGRLVGPGDVDLGPVTALHRAARGVAWRMEAHLPPAGGLAPYLSATWGFYRVGDDVRGTTLRTADAAGFGLGFGVARPVTDRHAGGVLLRYQQLSRGGAERYLSAALEWRWGAGATE